MLKLEQGAPKARARVGDARMGARPIEAALREAPVQARQEAASATPPSPRNACPAIPWFPRQRLTDLLADANFLEAQLQVLQEQAGPHWSRGSGRRIALLHRRVDDLEQRLRARARSISPRLAGLPFRQLRRQLGPLIDRRRSSAHNFTPERRVIGRRASDVIDSTTASHSRPITRTAGLSTESPGGRS